MQKSILLNCKSFISLSFAFLILFGSCSEYDSIGETVNTKHVDSIDTEYASRENVYKDIQEIKNDENFTDFIDNYYIHFSKPKDLEELNRLVVKEDLTAQEQESMAMALGYNSFSDLENYHVTQNDLLKVLSLDYDLANPDINNDLNVIVFDYYESTYNSYSSGTCKKRKNNCYASAFAVAVLEHIGCGVADLTIVLGIICHGAVTAIHFSAQNECDYQYIDCLNQ